jgi:hypothetical protein
METPALSPVAAQESEQSLSFGFSDEDMETPALSPVAAQETEQSLSSTLVPFITAAMSSLMDTCCSRDEDMVDYSYDPDDEVCVWVTATDVGQNTSINDKLDEEMDVCAKTDDEPEIETSKTSVSDEPDDEADACLITKRQATCADQPDNETCRKTPDLHLQDTVLHGREEPQIIHRFVQSASGRLENRQNVFETNQHPQANWRNNRSRGGGRGGGGWKKKRGRENYESNSSPQAKCGYYGPQ